ncbi:hypothetical protein B0H13DRAFT_1858766 [Mycena leptocephala]|nr:hypothetical protein B0H13DRAFT_1858766 [Mycena leptocephala]
MCPCITRNKLWTDVAPAVGEGIESKDKKEGRKFLFNPAAHRMDVRACISTLHLCSEGTGWERGFVTSPPLAVHAETECDESRPGSAASSFCVSMHSDAKQSGAACQTASRIKFPRQSATMYTHLPAPQTYEHPNTLFGGRQVFRLFSMTNKNNWAWCRVHIGFSSGSWKEVARDCQPSSTPERRQYQSRPAHLPVRESQYLITNGMGYFEFSTFAHRPAPLNPVAVGGHKLNNFNEQANHVSTND